MSMETKSKGMDSIFPDPVTMGDIRKMKRRNLSAAEASRPYARYYHKELRIGVGPSHVYDYERKIAS